MKQDRCDREGFIEVPGGRVWYRIAGAECAGVPLLVVHGGPGATHDYLEPLAALADERPVVFYDQLGSGSSDCTDDPALWTVEHFVEELGCVRAALGPDRLWLLGQSWGAALAVEYVLRVGSQGVAGLVLSGAMLSAQRWEADQRVNLAALPEPFRRAIEEGEARRDYEAPAFQEAMMAYYRRHVCRLDPWPDCLVRTFERMAPAIYHHMWGASEFTVTGTLAGYDVTGRLGAIDVPTLFTCGRYDEASPDATAWYRILLPGSEMIVFEEASHEHHLEREGEYLTAVRAFLHR